MLRKLDHIVITTSAPEACLAFYSKLGFTIKDAGGRYELYAGDFKINVHILGRELSPHAGNVTPGSSDLCFEIEGSLEVFMHDLESKGLTLHTGIVSRTGVKGSMCSFYLYDPDGTLLEFCSYS